MVFVENVKNYFVSLYKLIFRVLQYSIMLYIFPVILLAGTFNISRFYELETCLKVNKTQVLNFTSKVSQEVIVNGSSQSPCKVSICPTVMRKSLSYCRDYILIANFVMMKFIPLLVLSAVNIYRFITVSARSITKTSSRQKRDQRIARILIVIVLVFTCCNVPRAFIDLYEVNLYGYGNLIDQA